MDKLITLDNLTKSYDGNCVLDHITHDFYAGESIAFTGHNGCGKSTLLKILAGLISISSGKVCCHKKIGFSFVPEKFPGMDIRMTDYLYAIAGMESVETAPAAMRGRVLMNMNVRLREMGLAELGE